MVNYKNVALALLGVIILGIAIYFIFFYNTFGTFKTAFVFKDLKQSNSFYSDRKKRTANYLKGVYPQAAHKIDNLSYKNLSVMYNSLTFYYNCCYEQKSGGNFKSPIPVLDPTCCSKYPLPYIPQGWLYDVKSFKNGKAIVYSDGDKVDGTSRSVDSLISNTPQIPWGMGGGFCGEGPNCGSDCEWGADKPLDYFSPYCSGPGPFWIVGYTILKAYYHPHGPTNDKMIGQNKYDPLGWKVNEEQSDDDYTYPVAGTLSKKWWKGVKKGGYIEVTHSDLSPGMSQSQGFWMNGFPSGGTGLFYRVGRTKIAKNKLDMLFDLLLEIRGSSKRDLNLPNLGNGPSWAPESYLVDYSGMNGSQLLKHFYGTDDPYIICWKYIAGHNNSNASSNKIGYDSNHNPDPKQDDTNKIWNPYAITSSSSPTEPNYLVVPANWYWFDNGMGALGMSGLMNPHGEGGTWLKKHCPTNGGEGVHEGFDVNNVGKPHPFGTNHTIGFLDTLRYKLKLGNNGFPSWQQCKDAIDQARNNDDYYLSRVGVIVTLDEPILWTSRILGYKTLQQPQSANSNGYWQWEVIDTTVPDDNWLRMVKGRIYPYMTGQDGPGMPVYTQDGLNKWMNLMGEVITIRDPFDVNNDDKAEKSHLGGLDLGTRQVGSCNPGYTWYNETAKRNECASGGTWGCCPNAKKFPGQELIGYFDESTGDCYPEWKNIYHPDNISKHYSQITIFTGQNDACLGEGDWDKDPSLFCGKICTSKKQSDSVKMDIRHSAEMDAKHSIVTDSYKRLDDKRTALSALAGRRI